MPRHSPSLFRVVLSVWLALGASLGWAAGRPSAETLLAKQTELQSQLRASPSGEPIHLTSTEADSRIDGDVYAEAAVPFARISTVLRSADSVCGLLFLHLNVRSCQPGTDASGATLTLGMGPKQAASDDTSYSMVYHLQVQQASPNYVWVTLTAATGPLATQDYRIVFEAAPLADNRTFLHFGYSYGYGTLAKMIMGVYLTTTGRNKIGFTVTGTGPDGHPTYVQGERGALERNVMRNYLALVAYAGVTEGTPQAQTQARLRAWFAMTERHSAQLHELDLNEYLKEKQSDLTRLAAHAP